MKEYRWICLLLGLLLVSAVEVRADLLSDGWSAYNKGNYEEAYDLFSKAFRADPGNVNANFALGEAAYQKKKYSHAVFAYNRVLMVQPTHEKALLGKAAALMALGQPDEARDAYSTVLNGTTDGTVRDSVMNSIKQIDKSSRVLVLKGKATLSGIYDDNINYGNDNNIWPSTPSQEAAGLEGGLDLRAEYDVGQKDDWVLISGLSLFDSWYNDAHDQEVANARIYGGLRNVGKRNMVEVVGRSEWLWYGGNPLVTIYGGDGAWLFAANKQNYFNTQVSLESRDYDSEFDPMTPMDDRDSIYAQVGETWKYYFSNRNNNLSLGVDLFSENAQNDMNSNLGYRIRADGQMELPGNVIMYAGGRYRLAKYDAPAMFSAIDREDDRWDLLIGAKRQFANRVWLDLQYLHVWNTSTVPAMEYERNRISLSAIYEF
jgi:hypothetical protein